MADRRPNPDLWMARAGPRQPLKGVFYTQMFLSQNFTILAILLMHLLLANCVIVDQAVIQLNCSAHLSWASKLRFLIDCFDIGVQQYFVTTMPILVKIVDSRPEYSNETFSFQKQYNYTNLFVHSYERCLSKGSVLQRFWSLMK